MNTGTRFPKVASRPDPYGNHRFRLKWDEHYVAGFAKVSALSRSADGTSPVPKITPGQTAYEAITLERGVTFDPAFEQWVNKVWDFRPSGAGNGNAPGQGDAGLQDFRKDVTLDVFNEAGEKVLSYAIHRCWPSEYSALPDLDAAANAVAISMLKLENEGWERASLDAEPPEPVFKLPEEDG